jgi:hypothetical protein
MKTIPAVSNSYSQIICNEMLARIKLFPQFASVAHFSDAPVPAIQNENVPYLAVYLMDEKLTRDGDANCGVPRFQSRTKVGFSYVIQNNDPSKARDILDRAYWAIMTGFLESQRWHRFAHDLEIEAVESGSRKFAYPKGRDNLTSYAELQADLTFMQRETFPPPVFDDLKSIHITVADHIPFDPERNEPFMMWIEDLDEMTFIPL